MVKKMSNLSGAMFKDLYIILSHHNLFEDSKDSQNDEGNQEETPGGATSFFVKVRGKIKSVGKKILGFFKKHKYLTLSIFVFILYRIIVFLYDRKELIRLGIVGPKDSIATVLKKLNAYTLLISKGVNPEEITKNFKIYAKRLGYDFGEHYTRTIFADKSCFSSYIHSDLLYEDNKDKAVFVNVLKLSFRDALKQSIINAMSSSDDGTYRLISSILLRVIDKHPEVFNKAFIQMYNKNKKDFDELYSLF